MKKALAALCALLLLAGCAQTQPPQSAALRVLCTTYPVYLFTAAVTEGMEDVEVSLLVNSPTSCLHDYTLTVKDMKAIEGADVIVMNGGGLEDFMDDALGQSDAAVIDCSEGMELLPTLEHAGHDGHDHEEEYDPHIWMDPDNAALMVETIADGLASLDGDNADAYRTQAAAARDTLNSHFQNWPTELEALQCRRLITFHDGFQYFADAFDLELLKAIEEEEGATASAHEIKEVAELVREYHIPAIFVEKNGSRATADAISRETGCRVYELDMLMSGDTDGVGLQIYISRMCRNLEIICTVLNGQELHDMEGL